MAYRENIPPGQAYQGQERAPPPGYHPEYYPNGNPTYATQQQSFTAQSFAVYPAQAPPQNTTYPSYSAGFDPPPISAPPPVQYVDPMFLQQMISPMPTYQLPPAQAPTRTSLAPQDLHDNTHSAHSSPKIEARSPSVSSQHLTSRKDSRRASAVSGVAKSPLITSVPSHVDPLHALIYVAEDCFTKANVGAPSVARSMSDSEVDEHHKLVSTGLRCLEVALQLKKLTPRQEARIRLRYAGALVDETTNNMAAETALTENLALCQKHLFADIKYCSQFLLLKVLFQRNPKSAHKSIDKHISDCETYQHYQWAYAFRFLKAALFLQSGNPADHEALENLRKITEISERRQDKAVFVMASLLEGLAHLSASARKDDAIVKVQTCIAQASKLQLEESVHIPQLDILLVLLDFACALHQKRDSTTAQKLSTLQKTLDELRNSSDWSSGNEILLPVKKQSQATPVLVSGDTRAILRQGSGESDFLVLTGLGRVEYWAIAHIFHGIYATHKATTHGRDVALWMEAIKLLEDNRLFRPDRSLPEALKNAEWVKELVCYARVLMGLSAATSTDPVKVKDCIDKIKNSEPPTGFLDGLTLYLSGVFYQGVGNLEAALEIWSDERFRLDSAQVSQNRISHIDLEVSILATFNQIWVLFDPQYRNEAKIVELLELLRPFCDERLDVERMIIWDLVSASVQHRSAVTSIKNHMQRALHLAQRRSNSQCLSLALNLMRDRMFNGVIGEQALKSVKAAHAQAKRTTNLLWMSAAQGMLADSLEKQGSMPKDAIFARDSGKRLAEEYSMRVSEATKGL